MNNKFMLTTNVRTSQEFSSLVTKCERETWFIGNFWYGFISLYAQIHQNDRAQFTVECFAGIFVDNDYFFDGCYSAECKLKAGGCRRGCVQSKCVFIMEKEGYKDRINSRQKCHMVDDLIFQFDALNVNLPSVLFQLTLKKYAGNLSLV